VLEIKKYFNSSDPNSKANKFRRKRFELFLKVFDDIINKQERVDILDVGGCLSCSAVACPAVVLPEEIFWKIKSNLLIYCV
jgi:hypothetical protein